MEKKFSSTTPYIVVDIESTGLKTPFHSPQPIEIAASLYDPTQNKVISKFHTLIKPEVRIQPGAARVHKITESMLQNAPGVSEGLQKFFEFAGENPLVGHNIGFDFDILQREAKQRGINVGTKELIDTLPIARELEPNLPQHTLDFLSSIYGIAPPTHRAAADVESTIGLISKLSKGEGLHSIASNKAIRSISSKTAKQGAQKAGKGIGGSIAQTIAEGWTPRNIGILGGVAGTIAGGLLAYKHFSGKDDEYNTIPGLAHGGFAQKMRRQFTDFGSGYQGLNTERQDKDRNKKGLLDYLYQGVKGVHWGVRGVTFGATIASFGKRTQEEVLTKYLGEHGPKLNKLPAPLWYTEQAISILKAQQGEERKQAIGKTAISIVGWEAATAAMDKWLFPKLDPLLKKFPHTGLKFGIRHYGSLGAAIGLANIVFPNKDISDRESRDKRFHKIEGLSSGGMAEQLRKENTEFGSPWKGQKKKEKKDNKNLNTLLATYIGTNSIAMGAYHLSPDKKWINAPETQEELLQQVLKTDIRPGDVIFSRNTVYTDPFHSAIVGDDGFIYDAYLGDRMRPGGAELNRKSLSSYIGDQLISHPKEGMPYPIYGIARDSRLTAEESLKVATEARLLWKAYEEGVINPLYGFKANQGVNQFNCLSLTAKAYKEAGKEFFHEGTNLALPWNVDLSHANWVYKGPAPNPKTFKRLSGALGIGGIGLGVATLDPGLIAYGTAMMGLSHFGANLEEQVGKAAVATILSPNFVKKHARSFISTSLYSTLAYPLVSKGIDLFSSQKNTQSSSSATREKESSNNYFLLGTTLAATGYVGYEGYKATKGNVHYSDKSKRLLILADRPEGAAMGHMAPSEALQGWLKKHGWEADIIGGLDDLSSIDRAKKYRAFVDSGYNTQWIHGLPGIGIQWDVQTAETAEKGIFRGNLRPNLGLNSPGMAWMVPTEENRLAFSRATGQDNFFSFDNLVVRPEVVEKAKKIKEKIRSGTLDLPRIPSGQKFLTVSGGGTGVGVPEAVKSIIESSWLQNKQHKIVVFAGSLEKNRPEEYKALMTMVGQNPERFHVFDLAPGGPGRRLSEYMAAAEVNIFAGGASTSVEAAITGKPFIALHGAGIPSLSHFIDNPKYMEQKFGNTAAYVKLSSLSETGEESAKQMRTALDHTTLNSNRSINRIISESELDAGQRLIEVIETMEKRGKFHPSSFRPTVQNIIFPLAASNRFKNAAIIGGTIIAGIAGVKGLGSLFGSESSEKKEKLTKPINKISGKDDDYNTIKGLNEKGLAAKLRKQNTDFGSGYQGQLTQKDQETVRFITQLLSIGAFVHGGYGVFKGIQKYGGAKQYFSGLMEGLKTRDSEKMLGLLEVGETAIGGLEVVSILHNWIFKKSNQKIPKENRSINPIEGMSEKGIGPKLRKENTVFGSKHDRLKLFLELIENSTNLGAKQADKNFLELLKSGEVVRPLGEGVFGKAELMRLSIPGMEKPLEYVRKTSKLSRKEIAEQVIAARKRRSADMPWRIGQKGEDAYIEGSEAFKAYLPSKEASALQKFGEESEVIPNLYGFDRETNEIFMEAMPGRTLQSWKDEYFAKGMDPSVFDSLNLTKIEQEIGEQSKVFAKAGRQNLDIHTGNILFDPETSRVSWIDQGWNLPTQKAADTSLKEMSKRYDTYITEEISSKLKPPNIEEMQRQEDMFFDLFGDESLSPNIADKPISIAEKPSQLKRSAIKKHLLSIQLQQDQAIVATAGINGGNRHQRMTTSKNIR